MEQITEKEFFINALTIRLADKVIVSPSDLRDLISDELSMYSLTKMKTTLPSTGDGSTTKYLFKKFTEQKIAEGAKASTLKAYLASCKTFYAYIQKELNLVTSDDVIEFMDWYRLTGQKGHRSDNTVRNMFLNLSSFYSFLFNYRYIGENIFKTLKTPKGSIPKKQAITSEEMERITIACEKYRKPLHRSRDLAIINFMNETGVRVSELCKLTIGDINLAEGCVLIKDSKSKDDRITYFFDKTRARLYEYFEFRPDIDIVNGQLAGDPSTPLFASFNKNHSSLSTNAIRVEMSVVAEIADIPRLHPHLMRSTMATNCLQKGVNPVVVQKVLGHQSLETMRNYEALTDEFIYTSLKLVA